MSLHLYNTYSKRQELFRAQEKGVVRMYNCGPTVWDYAHIGNFRSFLTADVLRRYLEHKGYVVHQVMNITDVGHMTQDDLVPGSVAGENEDKMVRAMRRTGIVHPQELALFYTQAFLSDSRILGCLEPEVRPRASDHIPEMLAIIETLLQKGHAYIVDGFVYFAVNSFRNYGKLSGNTVKELVTGARVEVDARKKNPADFTLWKADEGHLMKWPSPWSVGFPGWHIECTAMAMKYLGQTLDIHTGGEDNIFPHHEAEIAQSEGATAKTFARYWVHTRHLLVDGAKMSKSRGNFFTLRDLLAKGYRGEEIRFCLIASHYSQNLNFATGLPADAGREAYSQVPKIEALEEARAALRRLRDFRLAMKQVSNRRSRAELAALVKEHRQQFETAMDDDLNVALALAAVFAWIREVNKLRDAGNLSQKEAQVAMQTLDHFTQILGLVLPEEETIPQQILAWVQQREEARRQRDYKLADELREKVKKGGFALEDTPQGPLCKRMVTTSE